MMTVSEAARISGVSVRTLHHYDSIGLLHPAQITEAGYRLYDENALIRLQQILMYRELEFSLKDIGQILDSPSHDIGLALDQQIELLQMKRAHIDDLLSLAQKMRNNGGLKQMDFAVFDQKKMHEYARRAKERWGKTEAYREFEQRDESRGDDDRRQINAGLMEIFTAFGAIRDTNPADAAAQAQVQRLQQYITKHFYNCTKPILASLGTMYAVSGEMHDNIDRAGGNGTAQFTADAIAIYCR